MHSQFFKVVQETCQDERGCIKANLSLKEESNLYWWYYNEMETPTEEQLRYRATRYAILGNVKWYKFLIQSFPTEENLKLVTDTACDRYQNNVAYYDVIRSLLKASPLTDVHLDLASTYGGRSTRRKVTRIRQRIRETLNYEI